VVLIIVCAAALAFVVLYNLTNINITERMRELATLKVLGFYDGELSAYVYRENVILTVFGVAMGMLMGKLLHQWLILTVEIDLLMFGRVLAPSCYIYSIVLTVLFSLLVNLSAHKKLKKLAMVESLKTVE
jgi:putative ABC transport system permease protein